MSHEPTIPRLSPAAYWGVIAAALAVFFFVSGPVWERPWDIDLAVYWSYGAIPVAVVAIALATRRFSWVGVLLDCIEIGAIKFGVTYFVATFLWFTAGEPPPPEPPPPMPPEQTQSHTLAEPSIIPPSSTGTIRGRVVDENGSPLEARTVFVAGGLEALSFAPPGEPVRLSLDGDGVVPNAAVIRVGQALEVHNTDERMHTLQAVDDAGRVMFNFPVLPGRRARRVFYEPTGVLELRDATEETAQRGSLVVLSHPFWSVTDNSGRFEMRGVPYGELHLRTLEDAFEADARIRPGEEVVITLRPPASR